MTLNWQAAFRSPRTEHYPPPFGAFLADLEALGVHAVAEGGLRYGRIGARSNARWWLVPLGSSAQAVAGLAMFQPMSRGANLAKLGVMALMRAGLDGLWARDRLRLSGLPRIDFGFDAPVHACAYFTGTAGPHRKTAIQFMARGGRILGYAKMSRTPAVRDCLRNEAHFLRALREMRLTTTETPECLELDDARGLTVLVTDSNQKSGHSSPKVLVDAHMAFMRELAARTTREGADVAVAALAETAGQIAHRAPADWTARMRKGISLLTPRAQGLRLCMAHGDFTPWNCFLDANNLYVFDWEYGREAYPLGFDFVHFCTSAAWPCLPNDVTVRIITDLVRSGFYRDEQDAAAAVLLSLLLVSAFYLKRAFDAGESATDWEREPQYARLIDIMLARVGT